MLPADILRFVRVLDFSQNKLRNVPLELMQLQTLEELYLDNNEIRFFPQPLRLPALRTLQVTHNFLEFLPDGLQECTSLTKLDLRYAHCVLWQRRSCAHRSCDCGLVPCLATMCLPRLPSCHRAKLQRKTTQMIPCSGRGNGRLRSILTLVMYVGDAITHLGIGMWWHWCT